MRLRLLFSEAWRSLGANLSTTFAAMMTVLIGMFLLGLLIALGTWTVSWSNHVKRELVVKIDFKTNADKGEFVFVVGASGSGKSTLVRLLLKELEATKGKIVVGGRDLTRLKRSKVPMLRRNIGCVFQDFKLLPNRTAAENVAYALKVQGESRGNIRKKVPEVLSMVGLSHRMNALPDELSGGEQQRVSIARAFVNHPPLLVCDEPTGNLDPDTSVGIMQLLYRINRAGTTVLMVTHDREMVDKMRKRVIQLEDGRLARDERRGGYTGD